MMRMGPANNASSAQESALVVWDEGRLQVVAEAAPILERHGLTTFRSLYDFQSRNIAKDFLKERVTVRIELASDQGTPAFYLKRHSPVKFREHLKSWIRLRKPIIGAGHEWEALRAWRSILLPTQTPIAYGRDGGNSLLLTAALDECDKLSWLMEKDENGALPISPRRRQELTRSVARLIRRMHDLGWHHQDCYCGHVMIRREDSQPFLIDLGRACRFRGFRKYWIRKDLAQFAYSARGVSLSDQFRFLRAYWGRPFRQWERRWCRKILRRVQAISRHSEKRRG